MTKKSKQNHVYNGIQYDSKEEIEFQKFLDEAKEIGLVKDFKYQPESFILIPKSTIKEIDSKGKVKEKVLYREHKYTADWEIWFDDFFDTLPHNWKKNTNSNSYLVDIKGMYNAYGGDRIFPIHQKLLYSKFKKHVNKVIPEEFFKQINTVPEKLRYKENIKKSKEIKKAYVKLGTIADLSTRMQNYKENNIQINFAFFSPKIQTKD